ncbi:MAG: glycine--tRNA ligase [SAR202 cluster bacterium]|nr:glycine--tRNA ligase [SAR202 cluster bacterium]
MDKIVSLCKRRGFIFQSSEIYGGLASTYDYGPLGIELKRNIRDAWWRRFIQYRDDMVGIESAILMHPQVWVASGHSDTFTDPLVECKACHHRFRQDNLTYLGEVGLLIGSNTNLDVVKGSTLPMASENQYDVVLIRGLGLTPPDASTVLVAARLIGPDFHTEKTFAEVGAVIDLPKDERVLFVGRKLEREESDYSVAFQIPLSLETATITLVFQNASGAVWPMVIEVGTSDGRLQMCSSKEVTACPDCGGELTEARHFNLMLKTFLGPVEDTASQVYLRPETAQGIFVNFQNVLTATRKRLPFGIGQIGKSFRNEITTGNFTFRTREFEQMEIEFFVKPGTDEEWHQKWVDDFMQWFIDLGVREEKLRLRPHAQRELSHYSKATSDIEYSFSWGWGELMGIANRTDFDLKAHTRHSGIRLDYFDDEVHDPDRKHYAPYVVEPALGVDRALLVFLFDAYDEEIIEGDTRVVLHLHSAIAPIKVAVLPLSRNERLVPKAREVYDLVRSRFTTQYDDAQSIGRRYRRQDEIGTPLAVTVDFQTLDEDNAVTIRDRDTMEQVRVPISELMDTLTERLDR